MADNTTHLACRWFLRAANWEFFLFFRAQHNVGDAKTTLKWLLIEENNYIATVLFLEWRVRILRRWRWQKVDTFTMLCTEANKGVATACSRCHAPWCTVRTGRTGCVHTIALTPKGGSFNFLFQLELLIDH